MEFHASCIRKTNNLRSSNLDKVDSRGAGDRNTLSDRGEYRYVLTPRSLSSPRSFFAYDRWETEKMRSTRQEGRKSWTRSREGAAASGVGGFRECRRLRLMLFTQSPGYRAFLQHDWLLPRAPVRSLVLSNRIVGARGTTSIVVAFSAGNDSFITLLCAMSPRAEESAAFFDPLATRWPRRSCRQAFTGVPSFLRSFGGASHVYFGDEVVSFDRGQWSATVGIIILKTIPRRRD